MAKEAGKTQPGRNWWRAEGVPPLAVAAALSAAVLLGLTAASLAAVIADGRRDAVPAIVRGTPGPTEEIGSAPATGVRRIHTALHDIGTSCAATINANTRRRVRRDVDVILSFARRYPTARFRIDDETGGVLSLLLVARNELRECAPAEAARVDRALPPDVRNGLVPLPSVTD